MHRIEAGIDRPVAAGLHRLVFAIHIQCHRGKLRPLRARNDGQRDQLDPVLRIVDFIINQGLEILVIDMFFPVCQILEAAERIFQGVFTQFIAQFLKLFAESMAA